MTIESINYQSADVEDFEKSDCRIIGNAQDNENHEQANVYKG